MLRRLVLPTVAIIGTAGCAGSAPPVDPAGYASGLVEYTNAARQERGLDRLVESSCAADLARDRAAALVGRELEHAPLDPVIETCQPASGLAAENLSRTASPPTAVVAAWLGSPGHANNLLSPQLTAVGVGCVHDPSGGAVALVCSEVFLG